MASVRDIFLFLGGDRGVVGLGREGQDTGASQLSCYSSSNEGVETRALIRPGRTGSSMWKLTRMEWGSGLRPHSGRCV
jgi:hypothetical protein